MKGSAPSGVPALENKASVAPFKPRGKQPGPTIDPVTGSEVGRFIADGNGNVMIEPKGGSTIFGQGRSGADIFTLYPNGSNYQRFEPMGHPPKSTQPHGHGHELGTGPKMKGQGNSLDVHGNRVPWNSKEAHWDIY